MEYKSMYESMAGTIIMTSDGKYLTGLWFTTSRFPELRIVKQEQLDNELVVFQKTKDWLDRYFRKEQPNIAEIPLKLEGSAFSKDVWEILKDIPYGATITYGDIAKELAKRRGITRMSAQAVGHAVGHNPISIIIPCHRVMGANQNLTGYGGGLDVKVALLKHEGVDTGQFYRPKKGNAL